MQLSFCFNVHTILGIAKLKPPHRTEAWDNKSSQKKKKNNLQVCRDIKMAGLKYAQVKNQQRCGTPSFEWYLFTKLYIASSEFLR